MIIIKTYVSLIFLNTNRKLVIFSDRTKYVYFEMLNNLKDYLEGLSLSQRNFLYLQNNVQYLFLTLYLI